MVSPIRVAALSCALLACDSSAPAPVTQGDAKPDVKADVKPDAKADAKADAKPPSDPTPRIEPTSPTTALAEPVALVPKPLPPGEEIAIAPWSTATHKPVWTEKSAPAEPIVFAGELYAGVLGKAGASWHQLGSAGELVPATMDIEPTPPIMGVWPDDAWMVQTRWTSNGSMDLDERRLMKLRGGDRWVPQKYGSNAQWFHASVDEHGVSDFHDARMSTQSGMLMQPWRLESITRVAGRHDDPRIGPHRGRPKDFLETGAGKIYVITEDAGAWYAQTECEDDACVATAAKKLPLADWKFGRRVSRGNHSVSVIATSGARTFILHHRGKSDGWLLEELPAGETPNGMWNSEEGGLWTLTGEALRWRDTEGAWRDVVAPDGLTKPSVALSQDRKTVWLAGEVGGAGRVFTTPANAVPPAG